MIRYVKAVGQMMKKAFRNFKRKIKDFFVLKKQKKVLNRFLKNAKGKKILLISHQLTTNGAPFMLYNLAKELTQKDCSITVASYQGGGLEKNFKKLGAEVLCGEIYRDNEEVLKKLISNFDKVIVNSVVCFSAVKVCKDSIWWIHEGQNIELGFMSDYPELKSVLRDAGNIFVVSDYAKKTVDKYNQNSQVIRLGIKDLYNPKYEQKDEKKIKIALVGSVCECKAQDVFADAILKLDKNILEQSEFHFFCEKKGRRYRKIKKQLQHLNNIIFEGHILNQDLKWSKFAQMDVFVIPSRDESCSLVTLEACMLKKPVIVSENVGAKYMVKEGENGYIVKTGDSESLKEAIEKIILNKNGLSIMGEISRIQYQKFASFENHLKELQKIIDLCIN